MELKNRSDVDWKLDAALRSMRVHRGYKGFYYLIDAVKICLNSNGTVLRPSKEIYPKIAQKYGVTTHCVEHNLRHLGNVIWKNGGKDKFCKIAGYDLDWKPTNIELIDALVNYIERRTNYHA